MRDSCVILILTCAVAGSGTEHKYKWEKDWFKARDGCVVLNYRSNNRFREAQFFFKPKELISWDWDEPGQGLLSPDSTSSITVTHPAEIRFLEELFVGDIEERSEDATLEEGSVIGYVQLFGGQRNIFDRIYYREIYEERGLTSFTALLYVDHGLVGNAKHFHKEKFTSARDFLVNFVNPTDDKNWGVSH